ncbi:MAG: DMT family transporter [Candidatus Eisenbacteria bacterium]
MAPAHLGELAALTTAVCWTVTGLSFEAASRRVGSLSVNLIRLFIAFGLLCLFGAITRGKPLPSDADANAWLWLGLSGLIGFSLGDLCLFRAYVLVGARVAMLMMSLVPPMVALIGKAFLHEDLALRHWVGMAVTVAGVMWVVLEKRRAGGGLTQEEQLNGAGVRNASGRRLPGVLLALVGAIGQAVGLVMSKKGMGDYNAFASTQIRILAGLAGFVILFFFIRWWPRVWTAMANRPAMARTALGATFGPFLGVSFSLLAVQHTQAGVAATIMAIVPVLIIAPAAILFHQRVTARAVLGACMAVAGVGILFLG